ncbi:MAG TPA: hydantoinase/oxoprolinase N-terminal domain-containing protein, partial [Candidatus Baltobacteraceae bacterium]|nr:hydantoinase/oxoprolinase N-terminal domain-containing protein [Candidatus Baltobacteraceae bacterium]
MPRALRLGIDVGGTFTDVVAIDAVTRELIAFEKVPTTHAASEGVAAGIVEAIARLLRRGVVDPSQVAFIAHSTTQATNALLEGDVARVGVLGLLNGLAPLARAQMRFPRVELAPGVPLDVEFAFARADEPAAIEAAVDALASKGSSAVAASQAFSVDQPSGEDRACEAARSRGLFATSGHEVSSLYGLRARTPTAALNAAIL